MTTTNAYAEAITQAEKYKAKYERTDKDADFDAYVYWSREVARQQRIAQEAAYAKAVGQS